MSRVLIAVMAFVAGWMAHALFAVALWLVTLSGLVVATALILQARRQIKKPPVVRKTIWINY